MRNYNNLFIFLCKNGNIEIAKFLFQIKPDINISINEEEIFRQACKNGNIEIAKFLFQIKPDINISINEEEIFKQACYNGNIEIAKWLLQIKPDINISINDEHIFRWVCYNGHLDIAKWLLQIKPDINISIKENLSFKWACKNGHIEVAIWLQSIKPDIYQIISNINNIIIFDIIKQLQIDPNNILYIDINNKNKCIICYDTYCQVKTNCNHEYCKLCISKWLNNNNTCPYCRKSLSNTLFQLIKYN